MELFSIKLSFKSYYGTYVYHIFLDHIMDFIFSFGIKFFLFKPQFLLDS